MWDYILLLLPLDAEVHVQCPNKTFFVTLQLRCDLRSLDNTLIESHGAVYNVVLWIEFS